MPFVAGIDIAEREAVDDLISRHHFAHIHELAGHFRGKCGHHQREWGTGLVADCGFKNNIIASGRRGHREGNVAEAQLHPSSDAERVVGGARRERDTE